MNRTTALVLTIVTALLCGCPGLCSCAYTFWTFSMSPEEYVIQLHDSGIGDFTVEEVQSGLLMTRICTPLLGLLLIVIPVLVGFFTLRRAKQTEAQQTVTFPPPFQ